MLNKSSKSHRFKLCCTGSPRHIQVTEFGNRPKSEYESVAP